MNASTSEELPAAATPEVPSSLASSPTTPSRSRSRLVLLVTALTLVALGAVSVWWAWRPGTLVIPLPDDLGDLEVRAVIAHARQEVSKNPTAATWGHLGMVCMANRFNPEAILCFQEAAKLDPGDSRWPFYWGLIDLRSEFDKKNAQAVNLFRQAVRINTWRKYASSMRFKLVELLLERNEVDEAEQVLREITPQPEDAPRISMNMGWIAMARGDTAKAQAYFTHASTSIYQKKKATAQLAILARLANKPAEADWYNKEATRMRNDEQWPDPLRKELYALVAGQTLHQMTLETLETEQKFKEAAAMYLEDLKTKPVAKNYLGAGINLTRCRDYEHAIPLLRTASQLDPHSAATQFGRAVALFLRAEEYLQKNPQSKKYDEDLEEAVKYARLATSLNPDHFRAYLVWGSALQYLGKREEAIEPLRQGIVRKPYVIDLLVKLGEVYMELGKFEDAQRQLDYAAELNATYPSVIQLRERFKGEKKANPELGGNTR